jgi:hypothetical protein
MFLVDADVHLLDQRGIESFFDCPEIGGELVEEAEELLR